jgi:hypothetical protein
MEASPLKAGPKQSVDGGPLPWRPRVKGAARFGAFCTRFIRVPKGTGGRRCQVRCKVLRSLVLDRFEIFGKGLVSEVVEFFALRLRAEQVAD